MGELTTRAGGRGRRHGDPDAPLVLVQRVVFSGDPGARTADAPAGHSPMIRSPTLLPVPAARGQPDNVR